MAGWVKIHRSMMHPDSSFQKLTLIQQTIFIHLILKANFKDSIWSDSYRRLDVEVKRGELVTSREKIKHWFPSGKVTDQIIRTALKRMEKLKMVTIKTTKSYTHIKVLNYCVYQDQFFETNQQVNQNLTNAQPTGNQELTTIEESIKNRKESKKNFTEEEVARLVRYFYKKLQRNGLTDAVLNEK